MRVTKKRSDNGISQALRLEKRRFSKGYMRVNVITYSQPEKIATTKGASEKMFIYAYYKEE